MKQNKALHWWIFVAFQLAATMATPDAQRRDASLQGGTNYHGSGSGGDSGDLVPPPGPGGGQATPRGAFGSPPQGDTYAPPPSYGPPKPKPVYGPPPVGGPSGSFGPPNAVYAPPPPEPPPPPPGLFGGRPSPAYGPPPKPPKSLYGAPPRPNYGPPPKRPRPVYGPPFGGSGSCCGGGPPRSPKPVYGPPKPLFGPPKQVYGPPLKQVYGPPKPSSVYGPPPGVGAPPTPPDITYDGWQPIPGLSKPQTSYGPPPSGQGGIGGSLNFNVPSDSYGGPPPPLPSQTLIISSHGNDVPSLPGIEYGVPPPSQDYGAPPPPSKDYGVPLPQPSKDYGAPPPSQNYGAPPPSKEYGTPIAPPSSDYGAPPPSQDYGAPPAPIKDYGTPVAPPSNDYGAPSLTPPSQEYGAPKPPSSQYGAPSPTAAGGGAAVPVLSVEYGAPTGGGAGGLIPPNTEYGIPFSSGGGSIFANSISLGGATSSSFSGGIGGLPGVTFLSTQYAVPSAHGFIPPSPEYGTPVTGPGDLSIVKSPGFDLTPPAVSHPSKFKEPVKFREPVPPGLLTSIGNNVAKGHSGTVSYSKGPTYLPPPVKEPFDSTNNAGFPAVVIGSPTRGSVTSSQSLSGSSSLSFSGGFGGNGGRPIYEAPPVSLTNSYGAPIAPSASGGSFSSSFAGAQSHALQTSGIGSGISDSYGAPTVHFGSDHNCGATNFVPSHGLGGHAATSAGHSQASSAHLSGASVALSQSYDGPPPPAPLPAQNIIAPPSAPSLNYGAPIGSPDLNLGLPSLQTSHVALPLSSSGPSISINYGVPDQLQLQSSSAVGQSIVESSVSINQNINGPSASSHATAEGTALANALAGYEVSEGLNDLIRQTEQSASSSSATASAQVYGNGIQDPRNTHGSSVNIPIQGSQGSYTLQIQSANGIDGSSSNDIHHESVLSSGLLKDILAAIEEPDHNAQQALQQKYGVPVDLQQSASNSQNQYIVTQDHESQQSVKEEVVIQPDPSVSNESSAHSLQTNFSSELHELEGAFPFSLRENGIALYFKGKPNNAIASGGFNSSENNDTQNKIPVSALEAEQNHKSLVFNGHGSYTHAELEDERKQQSSHARNIHSDTVSTTSGPIH